MPVYKTTHFNIDYLDVGKGSVVILIHSAASNNKQWRRIIEDNQDHYRFLAVNLYGYGETTPWLNTAKQTIEDQVSLIETLCTLVDEPVCLLGHSFGGTVAAYTALKLGQKVSGLVLLEANPFPLLDRENRHEEFEEIVALRDYIFTHGNKGDWESVGERFVNYWLGENAWVTLTPERQKAFVAALPNNLHEWDTVMNIDVSKKVWQGISAKTLLVLANETKEPIKGIYEILKQDCPHWEHQQIREGGHMAPVTRPDLVNPIILEFLNKVF
jgi:pimeloyl-ACP methyl ester carboxylesterase